jgi:hypothetical protein
VNEWVVVSLTNFYRSIDVALWFLLVMCAESEGAREEGEASEEAEAVAEPGDSAQGGEEEDRDEETNLEDVRHEVGQNGKEVLPEEIGDKAADAARQIQRAQEARETGRLSCQEAPPQCLQGTQEDPIRTEPKARPMRRGKTLTIIINVSFIML